jgi:hypothetical protein
MAGSGSLRGPAGHPHFLTQQGSWAYAWKLWDSLAQPQESKKVPTTLTLTAISGIKEIAAVAATRGDLGQLAPRKKLLKSW